MLFLQTGEENLFAAAFQRRRNADGDKLVFAAIGSEANRGHGQE
jgi:hypothetical protein